MPVIERIRRALRGPMYARVKGTGIEAIIVKDGIVQGVVMVDPDA